MLPALQHVIAEVDRTVDIDSAATLSDQVSRSVAGPRFMTTVVVSLTAFAIVLVGAGLYGVLSLMVAQRQRELGIRAALGASRLGLMFLVMREALRTTIVGTAIGLIVSAVGAQLLGAILFRVAPYDGPSFVTAASLILAVAIGAALFPGRRAASANPVDLLREE